MPTAKRNERRATRRGSKSEQPPALRREREHRIVRWIGAAKRRLAKSAETATVEIWTAHIIQLSFTDTFSRPIRPGLPIDGAQLLVFQG